ncbi:PREDICTED: F-box protein At1g10110-like [Camelina sativa]|uniref:F-box protein At1g10110-like n=1 Tax=Camelina sativa TaxID=90675 RepID=A0ABM0VXN4_CAMSA|nr:PREDICTED: F-box protein At1g10110-like [Camelina sativa]
MATDDDGAPNWSELVPDILSLVFKHLSFTDFARAKTVCSSWYSASKSSSPRQNHTPWLLLYEDTHWLLFNSEEGKFYRTEYFGRFAKCRGVATCGSWVLVFDKEVNFYIINPFTPKLIRLPPLESNRSAEFLQQRGQDVTVGTAVLWVDEKTEDYLVVWTYIWGSICYCRKRDQEWFEIPESSGCLDMAYKDKKLYIHTYDRSIRILDFSLGDLPGEIYNHPHAHRPSDPKIVLGIKRMKLTMSGDVLMVQRGIGIDDLRMRFQVYKMGSTREYWDKVSSGKKKDVLWMAGCGNAAYWERVHSLENEEALLWDLSVTLPTKGVSGIKKDSIYYCHTSSSSSIRDVAAYEIATHKISAYEIPKQTIEPSQHRGLLFGEARWFVPCFADGE